MKTVVSVKRQDAQDGCKKSEPDQKKGILLLGIFFLSLSLLYLYFLRQQEKTNIERIRTIYTERTENLDQ